MIPSCWKRSAGLGPAVSQMPRSHCASSCRAAGRTRASPTPGTWRLILCCARTYSVPTSWWICSWIYTPAPCCAPRSAQGRAFLTYRVVLGRAASLRPCCLHQFCGAARMPASTGVCVAFGLTAPFLPLLPGRRASAHVSLFLMYADDMALTFTSPEELVAFLHTLDGVCAECGLCINAGENGSYGGYAQVPNPCLLTYTLWGGPVKQVSNYKYLGSIVSADCTLDADMNARIGRAAQGLRHVWDAPCRQFGVGLKSVVFKTCVPGATRAERPARASQHPHPGAPTSCKRHGQAVKPCPPRLINCSHAALAHPRSAAPDVHPKRPLHPPPAGRLHVHSESHTYSIATRQ